MFAADPKNGALTKNIGKNGYSHPFAGRGNSERRSFGGNYHGDGYRLGGYGARRACGYRDDGRDYLAGNVLPVGGIKEKVLAAHRIGIRRILLPRENQRDLEDIPDSVRNELTFIFVRHMDEVLQKRWWFDGTGTVSDC